MNPPATAATQATEPDLLAEFVNDLLLPPAPPPAVRAHPTPATPLPIPAEPRQVDPSAAHELATSLDSFHRLFEMPEVEKIRPQAPPSLRCVSFLLGQQHYALAVAHLIEVLATADVMPVPGAACAILGVINLRGNIIPVLDPSMALGHRNGAASNTHQYLVAETASQPVAIRVHRVLEVISVLESSLRPAPIGHGPVKGLTSHRQEMLTVLDLDALLRAITT